MFGQLSHPPAWVPGALVLNTQVVNQTALAWSEDEVLAAYDPKVASTNCPLAKRRDPVLGVTGSLNPKAAKGALASCSAGRFMNPFAGGPPHHLQPTLPRPRDLKERAWCGDVALVLNNTKGPTTNQPRGSTGSELLHVSTTK